MKRRNFRPFTLLLTLALLLGLAPLTGLAADTSQEVHITMYVPGEAPIDPAPIEELSRKLKEKVSATFELVALGWDSTAFDLLFASGEPMDLVYVGAGYATSARSGALLALDDLLPTYAPNTYASVPPEVWEQAKVDGKIYAVPFGLKEFIPGGIVYRGDLLAKYGMDEITTIEGMEAYFDKVLQEEPGLMPFMPDTGWSGWYLAEMFINLTEGWIPLEIVSGMMFAAESLDEPEKLFYPVFTDEFLAFAHRMKEWDSKGYWSKDILSATTLPSVEFMAGKNAAYFQHAQGYIGTYGSLVEALPESDPRYWGFPIAAEKVLQQSPLANATAVGRTSRNPERALMVLDLLLTDREFNHLIQYGIQDKQYALDAEGFYTRPEGFSEAEDSYMVATWNLNVDRFLLPNRMEYPDKEALNSRLEAISHPNPFAGFAFDDSNVVNEVAAVNQVNSQLGTQLLLGKVEDVDAAVREYREQLTRAGIDRILEEVTSQYKAFREQNR